ncbi:MAG TPA: ArsR family transcriptional regulator [bacterium]|nr:ArsR family transcriptional regulator [bacterium]
MIDRPMQETRYRIVERLRVKGSQTVEELAAAFRLTRTAVTSHLAALRGDHLVRRRGLRGGIGRPSQVYELTPAADHLFPKAYDDFAVSLLEEIRKRPGTLPSLLRRIAGRWIARDLPRLEGSTGRQRVERARELLAERGFLPTIERTPRGTLLREHNCPLMHLAQTDPHVCEMIHQWLEALFAARLDRVQCLRRGDPFSAYTIGDAPPAARHRRSPARYVHSRRDRSWR